MLSQKCAIILPIRQEQESLFKLSETSIKKAINNSKGTFSQISTLNIKVENIGEGCDYSKTLNKGVKMAQSDGCDWVFFLNCGDIVVPDIFKNVAPYLSSYDAVWGQIYTYKVGSGSKIMAEKDLKQLEWTDNKKDTLLIDPHINIQIGHFVKTSIASSNPFNEKIMAGEDFEYCLHIWENYKCIKIPRPLYCKRHSMYLNSQQSTYNQQRMTTASSILEEYKNAKINNLYTTKGDKEKYYMDVAIYGIMRSGTTILSDMLTVKDKSIILHEPEVMYTHYKKSNFEKLGHKRMFTQLQEFGFNVSEIKIWDRVKYPSFIQFFDSKIYPLLSHLKTWGVKMVYFDNWEGFLAAYQPQKLILCVRDIRDVVLSEFDLAIRLNNLVADESWMEKRIIESCKQLVKMSKLNHYFLARYEDLCSNPDVKWQAAQYVGLKELGNERPSFEKISPFRKYELEKHGNGISNSSIYRHRSEPFGPALALANHVWRSCPEYSETFGYEIPPRIIQKKEVSSNLSQSGNNNGPVKDNSLSTEFSHFKHLQLGQSKRTARTAAVEFIPEDSVVLDLSCGTMSLEPKLTEGCKYIPCDTVKRDTRTLICNPNEEILPESNDATIVVALGLLEYIKDVATFFKNLKEMCGLPVVLSYHPADNVPLLYRIELDWINHLKKEELILMLQHAGYNIEKGRQIDENQILLRAKPNPSKSEL